MLFHYLYFYLVRDLLQIREEDRKDVQAHLDLLWLSRVVVLPKGDVTVVMVVDHLEHLNWQLDTVDSAKKIKLNTSSFKDFNYSYMSPQSADRSSESVPYSNVRGFLWI
jgi:hypothetical protein